MSTLRFVSRGEVNVLDRFFAGDMTLHLFTNDVETGLTETQLEALDAADFTEATFAGYAAVTLTGGLWSTLASNPSEATYDAQTFTRTSTGTAQLVRGYYVTDVNDAGALSFYEQFDGPVSIEFTDDALTVTPEVRLDEGAHMPTGSIEMFGGASAPTGWLLCQGQAVSRTTFEALFAVIGTTFGVGDGSTTFNVPDMRQRFPIGKAASGTGSTLGGTGGAIDHVHDLDTSTSHAKTTTTGNLVAFDRKTLNFTYDTTFTATGGSSNVASAAVTTATTLGGDSDTANPPFLAVNFIIKT